MTTESQTQPPAKDKDILKPLDSHRPLIGMDAIMPDSHRPAPAPAPVQTPVQGDTVIVPKDSHRPIADPKN
ncbi:hypothetical protein [Streptomyces celluloflavus]|uniref:Sigma-like protein n=1 Tax=Streptomyces celluloflavus TaxID=58344 RepID=A0ABW7RBQ9_9ACTN|nr:hypothetical protein OG717_23100 [Streptomyces celluloflavus]